MDNDSALRKRFRNFVMRHYVLPVLALLVCVIIVFPHGRSSLQAVHKHCIVQALGSKHHVPSAEMTSECLECDILDIRSLAAPASGEYNTHVYTGEYTDANDWSLDGACHLPRRTSNSSQIITSILNYKDRCTDGSCTVWIAFIGDSQLRAPFDHMIRVLLGQNWTSHKAAYENMIKRSNGGIDRRVCCSVPIANQSEQRRGQFNGTNRLDCSVSNAFDTPAYARNYLRENVDQQSTRFCLTWQWSAMADVGLRQVLANYSGIYDGGLIRLHDAVLAPQMIVVNPGLHAIAVGQAEFEYVKDIKMLLSQMRLIATTQTRMYLEPTRFVFHDITPVIDAQLKGWKVQDMNETIVGRFNEALNDCLSEASSTHASEKWLRVLPASRLTRQHDQVEPAGDGIHYVGAYNNIVNQLDLYFMNSSAASKFCIT